MRTSKRARISRGMLNNLRLRSFEILCEQCGTIYDDRTAEGLCWSCAGEEVSGDLEEEANRAAAEWIPAADPDWR